jgi:AraC-like DNA-binding protein
VANLAREGRASRAGFAKRFHDLLACGPIEYLTQLRMARAIEQMRDSRVSLSRVAELCGYESAAAFSKAFRKHVGQSPRDYRRDRRPTDR